MDRTFKDVADALGMSAGELADAFGVKAQTIRQMRLATGLANSRRPPPGWERTCARLAREKAAALVALADALDPPV